MTGNIQEMHESIQELKARVRLVEAARRELEQLEGILERVGSQILDTMMGVPDGPMDK